jgi:uncharacterized protein with FMN-binding domain
MTMKNDKAEQQEEKKESKVIKVALIVGFLVLLGIFITTAAVLISLPGGLGPRSDVKIGEVDLNNVADGTYLGSYEVGRWSNTLSVTVKDHRITGIKILQDIAYKHRGDYKGLLDRVIRLQSLKVDAIAGATVTSKAYLKAIENALSGTKPATP